MSGEYYNQVERIAVALEGQLEISKRMIVIAERAEQARATILKRDEAAQAMFEKEMEKLSDSPRRTDN